MSTKELHANWGKSRISGLSLFAFLKNILSKTLEKGRGTKPKTLIETFYYPELGSGQIYETIKEQVLHAGHRIFFNSYPTRIIHDKNHIVAANVRNDDENLEIKLDYLIESIHIVDFLSCFILFPPEYVSDAAKRLQYRSQVYLFVTLDRNKVTDDQWVYFPDPNTPFARISEMKNFSRKMSPLLRIRHQYLSNSFVTKMTNYINYQRETF